MGKPTQAVVPTAVRAPVTEPPCAWRRVTEEVFAGSHFDREPFSTWKLLRPGTGQPAALLVELPRQSADEREAFAAHGLAAPPLYAHSGRTFWTLRAAGAVEPPFGPPARPAWLADLKAVGGDGGAPGLPLFGNKGAAQAAPRLPTRQSAQVPSVAAQRSRDPSCPVAAPQGPVAPPVIAVIDTAFAFLHRAFRKPGTPTATRLISLWDQDEDSSALAQRLPQPPWQPVEGLGYGRELGRAAIDALLTRLNGSAPALERAVYRELGHAVPEAFDPWSHGTQVLALAAGQSDPCRHPSAAPDAASGLDLIAVQLPRAAVGHTHGIWLNTCVLDGIHYALRRAPPDAPVVVNISMGGSLGPHDGSSLLERAIDDLVTAWNGRLSVVLAAGNTRHSGMHTVLNVTRKRHVSFSFDSAPEDRTPNFVDLWSPSLGDDAEARAAADTLQMQVQVQDANGPLAHPCEVAPGDFYALYRVGAPAPGPPLAVACMSRPGRAVNGQGLQAFVGVAAVLEPDASAGAPIGEWTVTLGTHGKAVEMQAWIGRDDIPPGLEGEQSQFQFSASPPPIMSGTLSSLAGGRQTLVVGAYRAAADGSASLYEDSSEGGGGVRRPDVCGAMAVGGSIGTPEMPFYSDAPLCAPLFSPEGTREGTSFAAPFVTRRLANVLAAQTGKRWIRRAALLKALKQHYGAVSVPEGEPERTGAFRVKP